MLHEHLCYPHHLHSFSLIGFRCVIEQRWTYYSSIFVKIEYTWWAFYSDNPLLSQDDYCKLERFAITLLLHFSRPLLDHLTCDPDLGFSLSYRCLPMLLMYTAYCTSGGYFHKGWPPVILTTSYHLEFGIWCIVMVQKQALQAHLANPGCAMEAVNQC